MSEHLLGRAIAVSLATATLAAGCSSAEFQSADTGSGVVHEYGATMPPPKNIGRAVLAAVRITTEGETLTYRYPNGNAIGSWLVNKFVGSGAVLTYDDESPPVVAIAAHVAANTNDHCRGTIVTFPAGPSRSSGETRPPFESRALLQTPVNPVAPGADWSPNYNGRRDAAVIAPEDTSYGVALRAQEKVTVKPGDVIFAIGFGSRNGRTFDPEAKSSKDRSPIVVPGQVVAFDRTDGLVTFITGFSADPDAEAVVPGDSGGSVVDAAGRYIGDLTAAEENNDDTPVRYTGKQLVIQFGFHLPTSYWLRTFSLGFARVVTAQDVRDMASKAAIKPCQPTPVKEVTVPAGTDQRTLPRRQDYATAS